VGGAKVGLGRWPGPAASSRGTREKQHAAKRTLVPLFVSQLSPAAEAGLIQDTNRDADEPSPIRRQLAFTDAGIFR